jgi:hypothetical protein
MKAETEDKCQCEGDGQSVNVAYDEEIGRFFMICSLCDKFIDFCE